jgi:hypothetical protein
VLATLSTTRSDALLEQGKSTAAALTEGYQLAFLIGAGLVVVAIAVAMTVLQPAPEAVPEPEEDVVPAGDDLALSEAA